MAKNLKMYLAVVTTALTWVSGGVMAQDFPIKPITIVIGFTPGGPNDLVARTVAKQFEEIFKQPVLVDYRPGASGTLAMNYVARAKPDGYTLALGSSGPLVISQSTYAEIPYNTVKDFTPINSVALTPVAIGVNPGLNIDSMRDFVALSKNKTATIATSGTGGITSLTIELINRTSGSNFVGVPYKGANPAVADTIGGHVDAVVMDLPAMAPQITAGKLRLLAVTNETRSPMFPDRPTFKEQGLGDVKVVNWFGLLAPKDTPIPIIEKLNNALVKGLIQSQVKQQLEQQGLEVFTQKSPQDFAVFLRDEVSRWAQIVKQAGITPH